MLKKEALIFSDLHCSNKQLQNLYDFVIQQKKLKCLICAGDIVNMGEPVWFMEQFIKIIDKIDLPFLWVPGNNDFGRAYHKLNAKYKSIEGRVEKLSICHTEPALASIRFTGVGGSPASWAGQYAGESMIDQKKIAGSIFISHYPPPANIKLEKFDVGSPKSEYRNPKQISNSNNSNSKQSEKLKNSDLEFVSSLEVSASDLPSRKSLVNAPLVHISGHLHYKWGTAFLGQTKIVQLASLETGHYAIMDLETLAVKFERF